MNVPDVPPGDQRHLRYRRRVPDHRGLGDRQGHRNHRDDHLDRRVRLGHRDRRDDHLVLPDRPVGSAFGRAWAWGHQDHRDDRLAHQGVGQGVLRLDAESGTGCCPLGAGAGEALSPGQRTGCFRPDVGAA